MRFYIVRGLGSFMERIFWKIRYRLYEPGVVAFSQLRFPSESPLISQMAISFGLSTIKTLTEHYVPDRAKDNAAWYQKEMKGPYQDLAKIKIVVLE